MAGAVRRGGRWWSLLVGALGCTAVLDTDEPNGARDAMVETADASDGEVRDGEARDGATADGVMTPACPPRAALAMGRRCRG